MGLDVDIYTLNQGGTLVPEMTSLKSFSSCAPYEYEDGGAGVTTGDYEINVSKVRLES